MPGLLRFTACGYPNTCEASGQLALGKHVLNG